MLIPFGVFSAAGAGGGGGGAGAFEQIATTVLGSATSSVTFDVTGLGSTYKHLQLRFVARSNRSESDTYAYLRFNSDTTANYSSHRLFGNGSTVASGNFTGSYPNGIIEPSFTAGSSPANIFGSGVIDILDPFSSSKNKTTRSLSGYRDGVNDPRIHLMSGNWRSTSVVTSVTMTDIFGSFIANSRFSLYGIKG
jgi:hypothetical protein